MGRWQVECVMMISISATQSVCDRVNTNGTIPQRHQRGFAKRVTEVR